MLSLFITGAWGITVFAQTQQDSITKAKQGPCPAGMIFIGAKTQTATKDSVGTPIQIIDYYTAWPWQDCKTGKLFDKPSKKKTTVEKEIFFFSYKTDSIFCAIERIVEKEVECEVVKEIVQRDTLDRTPAEPDTSWAKYSVYPDAAIGKSKFTFKLGGGFRGTQYFAVRKDSLQPWQRRYLQTTWGGEAAVAIQQGENGLQPECTNCGSLSEKKKPGLDVGFDSKVFFLIEGRGKRTLLKTIPRYEVRWLIGLVYHITELHNGKTENRKEDGAAITAGIGVIGNNAKGPDAAKFTGPEVEFSVESRPFANWETHITLIVRGLFGGLFNKK